MPFVTPRRVSLAALVGLAACSGGSMPTETGPAETAAPSAVTPTRLTSPTLPVRFSELHYDNTGTDTGEAIEISFPVGTDVSGYSVVLYNGTSVPSQAVTYGTARTLAGLTPVPCGDRAVVTLTYPQDGIQNGANDGMALVDPNGTVVEFLSYEGVITASNGPAAGLTATDIGVSEVGTTPIGLSLQRTAAGTWTGPLAATFGICNDGESNPPPPSPVARVAVTPDSINAAVGGTVPFAAAAFDAADAPLPGTAFTWTSSDPTVASISNTGVATARVEGRTLIIATSGTVADTAVLRVDAAASPAELPPVRLQELHYDNVGADVNEAVVVSAPAGTNLDGWSIVLYNGNGGASYSTTLLTGVVANIVNGRGTRAVCYPTDGIQNGSPDGLALVDPSGTVVEFLSYEGTFTATDGPAVGRLAVDIGAQQVNAPIGTSLQRGTDGVWTSGAATYTCPGSIAFSGRNAASDPPLPVGYQDQLFATQRSSTGATVTTTFTWTSDTPDIATVDANGVVTARAAGSAVIRATAQDGTTGTVTLPTRVAVRGTAQYADHVEFGTPTDGTPADDYFVRHTEYVASFNRVRNIPNWVAYNLDASHFGPEDRCDCFTYDPALPADFRRYTTADYTGAGAAAGYGIDRGHLARSFDRTSGSLDNARSFLFTNIIPQASDNNQGPWAQFENVLGDSARIGNRELFIVAGASGSIGTVKNEGVITIPEWTWKVALILPRDAGLADVRSTTGVTMLAVVMPNRPGIRNVAWQDYLVTADSVERLSGYDVFAALPDNIERALESGTRAPIAVLDGPYAGSEGGPAIAFSAAGSSDPDGDALTYSWSFGDGTTASGLAASHVYAQDGTYTVELTVTDANGISTTATSTATIANVAPSVGEVPSVDLLVGERYRKTVAFTDPGADVWSAAADYGDGTTAAAPVSGRTVSLDHQYRTAGTFALTLTVRDDDASGAGTGTVRVLTVSEGIEQAIALVKRLARDGELRLPGAVGVGATLAAAKAAELKGNDQAALALLRAAQTQVQTIIRLRRLEAVEAQPLVDLIARLIAAVPY
jgi:DNA/RNA endonuclease G (NUC1)/PKD repeat protein